MKKINNMFFARPWAVKYDVLTIMTEIIERHLEGKKLSSDEIEKRIATSKAPSSKITPDYEVLNGIAKIPIYGIIAKRASMVNNISMPQGTSVEEIITDFKAAIRDEAVKKILLDIDSPGGSVDGIAELSDLIYNLRGKKPKTAFANGQMSSAAYWIGSAADKIYTSKSAEVGSIGVYAIINDETVADHMSGIKSTVIRAGKHKAAGHPSKPLTESDVADIQEIVNSYYDLFTGAVQRNRNMSIDDINEVANGKVFIGEQAVDNGLVDDIETIENLFDAPQAAENNKQAAQEHLTKCNACGKEFIYIKQQEIAMGAVACPGCGQHIDQEGRCGNASSGTPSKKEDKIDKTKTEKEEINMEIKDLTVALLKEQRKDLVDAIGAEFVAPAAESTTKAERKRIQGITETVKPYIQLEGIDTLVKEVIEGGDSVEKAEGKMKDLKLKALEANAPKSPGPGGEGEGASEENLSPKEQCKKDWEKNPKLHEEFASLESYTGFKNAESKKRIRSASAKK